MAALQLGTMNEVELREWVEANPERVNDRDSTSYTPLIVAVSFIKSLPLTVWLLDEKGANANARCYNGLTAIYFAHSLAILTTLLDRGADPAVVANSGATLLMTHAYYSRDDVVARLLQDPRVRATVNLQITRCKTALHIACTNENETLAASIVHLLLKAGANSSITNHGGETTPLIYLQQKYPLRHVAIALLEQAPDAPKASLLVKAHRLVVATISNVIAPSCLQNRAARGEPLSHVELRKKGRSAFRALGTLLCWKRGGPNEVETEADNFRIMLAFLPGLKGGPAGEGMPRDVFRIVLDLLMPSWDPLRRKDSSAGPPLQG